MSTTFSQQIINSRLSWVVIGEQKSNFIGNFKLEPITIYSLWFVVKNVVDIAFFFYNTFIFSCG